MRVKRDMAAMWLRCGCDVAAMWLRCGWMWQKLQVLGPGIDVSNKMISNKCKAVQINAQKNRIDRQLYTIK